MVVTMDKAKHNKNSYILRNVTKGKSHTFFCFVLLLHLNKHIVEKVQDRNGQFVFFYIGFRYFNCNWGFEGSYKVAFVRAS